MSSTVLLFFSTILILLLCPSHGDPVVDIAGNPVLPNTKYNIIPFVRGRGGGLTIMSRPGIMCPNSVGQAPQEVDYGRPLRLLPANASEPTVEEATEDVNVKFSIITICMNSNIWKIAPDGYISTNGKKGDSSSWFRFKKDADFDGVYEIVFSGRSTRAMCGKIGVSVEKDVRWLRLGGSRFLVRFRKVENGDDSHAAMLGYD